MMPCPVGLDIPLWMNLYNELALTHDQDTWEKAMKKEVNPTACIGCGRCTSHCPQSIGVPEIMDRLSVWPVK